MNTLDIFKKLSQGAIFKKSKTERAIPEQNSITIKQEKLEPDDDYLEACENDPDELTLLGNMTTSQNRKRKRKQNGEVDEKKKKMLEQEAVNRYRNKSSISVVGRHVPDPCESFGQFGLDEDLQNNVRECGYANPTPIQQQAIPVLMEKKNLLACAPTGSGKTAAFLLPILQHLKEPDNKGFRALIICPTRELANQIRNECIRLSNQRAFRVHIIKKINKALQQYGPKSNGKYDILITTPNRLCFLLKQDPPAISLKNVEWLVIDEADKLFEDSVRSFKTQLNQVLVACTNPEKKIAMFSATYMPIVAKWCVHNMKGLIRVSVGVRNSATSDVEQELLFVGNEEGKLLALRNLIKKGVNPPVLIFVQSKERAQQLFDEMVNFGINIDVIHADRTQQQRDETIKSFREGKTWILVCTELMARGVDFKGVNLVINYDFPPTSIAYIHRIGRAGRAGRKGKAVTFFTVEDQVNLRSIAHVLKQSGQEVPEYMLAMKKHSKKELKKLKTSAPKRKDINTTPIYERMKKDKWKKKFGDKKRENKKTENK